MNFTSLTWYGWVVVISQVVSALYVVGTIDRPRQPTTRSVAILTVLFAVLWIWATVTVGTIA